MTTPWIEPRTSQICVGSSKLLGLYSLRFQRYYISTNQGWRWHQLTTGIILCSVSVGTLLLTPVSKSQSSVMLYEVHSSGKHIPVVHSLSTANPNKACLLWWPPYSQHTSWQWCNCLDILFFMTEILLYDSAMESWVILLSVSQH